MDQSPSSSSKADRKTIEKNRRNEMKALYSNLNSLLPTPRETVSLLDQLEGAANYIKMLEAKLEEMKQKKKRLLMPATSSSTTAPSVSLPNLDILVMGSALEVALVTGLNSQFMFNQIITMLHEEGAEVVNATFTVLHHTIFHTIHSKIGESALDHRVARISERLRKIVYDFSDH